MLKIIHNLYRYANAKSCVRVGHMKSESFASNIEVQQGENLSPLVFCLFANDLSEFISHAYNGFRNISEKSQFWLGNYEIGVFFKFCSMHMTQ